MKNEFLKLIDRLIAFSFYSIFALVPLLMYPATFELFEFNKMWFVFGATLFIFFLWSAKCIINGEIKIRRTPLDIPLLLFTLSQVISTIFSLDQHVSFWGYYSRFNGGLTSTLSYVFLYYAFASNMVTHEHGEKHPASYKLLLTSLISGLIVALWGIPSHFGYDPTCLVFRGTFDVACWTAQFQPTIRIFSTLGQPNWMGTYMATLIPLAVGFGIIAVRCKDNFISLKSSFYLILVFLFYIGLIYANSQSSSGGFFVGIQIYFFLLFMFTTGRHKFSIKNLMRDKFFKYVFVANIIFFLVGFFLGNPIKRFDKYTTFEGLKGIVTAQLAKNASVKNEAQKSSAQTKIPPTPSAPGELGGSDSGTIRLIVWQGALEIFRQNPIFGTGVETYAYAYYKVKPIAHNLTSEWDYLYNKAHNEYLNYLATTGAFGLGTYLAFIFLFLIKAIRDLIKRKTHDFSYFPISLALIGSFATILISNFFGFSVVIVNLFLFFIPLLFYELEIPSSLMKTFSIPVWKKQDPSLQNYKSHDDNSITSGKYILIVIVGLVILYLEFMLITYWVADQKYALGYNLNRIGEYGQANEPLTNALKLRPGEDIFKDELAVNLATLSVVLQQQNQSTQAAQFANQAKQFSDEVIQKHPNNVVFFKSRTRILYTLAQLNPAYIDEAVKSIQRAEQLAPTDAKIAYNLALFYNQKGDEQKGIEYLQKSLFLKPNYEDAHNAFAAINIKLAQDYDAKNPAKARELRRDAASHLKYILENIAPKKEAQELLKSLEGKY
ncbi:MAG: hypothetical protein COX79_04560 [Candidatus Levybacteria bacterium CG_4_10_14_0_2_um_filter_36_16]|nr:MAG: hypothetical protein AUK12_03045 [Candidatus Levybacteria bacterium CG2_30_37_29]PIR79507.1 MAG: hypothetical protein COU26_00755 [Candidatus Levybacteria bacterium CG10_big_fil_rev_8_21_14_0_10_36_30]PIZ96706.1 MAG: hypothetical protein COX79_04560 [Candidatus Levybacteria bacterium CG_4_10_14_0_2_um_filter_36_16]